MSVVAINFGNYWINDPDDIEELNALFFHDGLYRLINRLLRSKKLFNVSIVPDSVEVRKFSSDYGIVFRLKITTEVGTTNTVEFRLFFYGLLNKADFRRVDEDAGLRGKDMPIATLIKLRILWIVFDQIRFFSVEENAHKTCNKKTHVACVWTQSPSGSMGREGSIN